MTSTILMMLGVLIRLITSTILTMLGVLVPLITSVILMMLGILVRLNNQGNCDRLIIVLVQFLNPLQVKVII